MNITTDPWTHVASCLPKLDHTKLAFSPATNPSIQKAYYTGQGWRWADGSADQADTITHWTDDVEPHPAPPITPIPGDVIPPIVKHWFARQGNTNKKIWLYSHVGSSKGYTVCGTTVREAQERLERLAHYRVPVIPNDATHLCYLDGFRHMDFTATEIRASLSALNTQPPTLN